jgi:hypothetical protein
MINQNNATYVCTFLATHELNVKQGAEEIILHPAFLDMLIYMITYLGRCLE